MEKVLFAANRPKFLLMLGSVTVPQPRIPPNLARHGTNPAHITKGLLLGTDQHNSTAMTGNTTRRTYPTNRGPSGTPIRTYCPEVTSSLARTPLSLLELLELKKGLLALGPEPLFEKIKREAMTTFI